MSRLDYITIGIVAACILAIIFLIFKMNNLFKGGKTNEKTEQVSEKVETETDDTYDFELDDTTTHAVETHTTDAEANPDAGTSSKSTTTKATSPEYDAASAPSEDEEEILPSKGNEPKTISPGGKFLVLAGSFSKKSGAEKEVARLRKMGYTNASVQIFDKGKFAVVMVDRFDNMAAAERLVKKLANDGVKSYVRMKSEK